MLRHLLSSTDKVFFPNDPEHTHHKEAITPKKIHQGHADSSRRQSLGGPWILQTTSSPYHRIGSRLLSWDYPTSNLRPHVPPSRDGSTYLDSSVASSPLSTSPREC